MKSFLFIIMISNFCFSLNKLPNDLKIDSGDYVHQGINFSSILFYLGLKGKSINLAAGFTFQFGISETIFCNSEKFDQGIKCGDESPDPDNTCKYDSVKNYISF